ncbi:unnamed protein product [Bemisia tabaci]|uniref:Uncharacterized protein n=1 Tax=Bemisia tabaci TaxID=7038 RepID=A0A9P0AM16_BEMTA|nr:unnamed protein product [Bemisia tabaci]
MEQWRLENLLHIITLTVQYYRTLTLKASLGPSHQKVYNAHACNTSAVKEPGDGIGNQTEYLAGIIHILNVPAKHRNSIPTRALSKGMHIHPKPHLWIDLGGLVESERAFKPERTRTNTAGPILAVRRSGASSTTHQSVSADSSTSGQTNCPIAEGCRTAGKGFQPTTEGFGQAFDAPRLEKSPLLANGYNQPPTHLNHMQFLPMNHPAHTAILPPGLSHHPGLPRPDSAIMKAQGIPGMEALAR